MTKPQRDFVKKKDIALKYQQAIDGAMFFNETKLGVYIPIFPPLNQLKKGRNYFEYPFLGDYTIPFNFEPIFEIPDGKYMPICSIDEDDVFGRPKIEGLKRSGTILWLPPDSNEMIEVFNKKPGIISTSIT